MNTVIIAIFKIYFAIAFWIPGRTNLQFQQMVLRAAFRASNGAILQWALKFMKHQIPPNIDQEADAPSSPLFPSFTGRDLAEAQRALSEDGYYIMADRLDDATIENYFAEVAEFPLVGLQKGDVQNIDTLVPDGARYNHRQADLTKVRLVRQLCNDPVLDACLNSYLGSSLELDQVSGWWSFPTADADNKAAQLFHMDLDRIKWLKIFIYMTDVSVENGAHCYIPGSHQDVINGQFDLRRYSDSEIFDRYGRQSEKVMTNRRGTVFIENTLGLHKGRRVEEGRRYVLQIQKSVNSFGYPNPEPNISD